MSQIDNLDKIGLSVRSHKLLKQLLNENPKLREIMRNAKNETEALIGVRNWVLDEMKKSTYALKYYKNEKIGKKVYEKLKWCDLASIRILDYIDNAGRKFVDLNLRGKIAVSNPIKLIWLAVTYGTGGAKPDFFEDMLELFMQFRGEKTWKKPGKKKLKEWMNRNASGLDPRIIKLREENRERILKKIIDKIDSGEKNYPRFRFEKGMSPEQKYLKTLEWWDDWKFHLNFAIRTPEELNEMLGNSLDPDTMKILDKAKRVGIPFFVNPYYLSLLHVRVPYYAIGADLALRDYVIYSEPLIKEFGHIVAWEKEDEVIPGKPNAAGWILPSFHNVHRRYPEVAILIPDTVGRACGGLCASCQRMYDFQNGHLNFDLDKLKPKTSWKEKLQSFMDYFENDSQLRDILITGGDALMSSDKSLKDILEAIYQMALRKRENNKKKKNGEKFAEIVRVRLGTRLIAYIPQRISDDLVKILSDFRKKALNAGIKQFVIQTHIQSPMEITPESEIAVKKILDAGWLVTNQHVYTISSSIRGHNLKLRKILNDIGIVGYYSFTVKGYMENHNSFTPNSRSVQEQLEEKVAGKFKEKFHEEMKNFTLKPENMKNNLKDMKEKGHISFLATDRNVLNLPGVGKSLTFRVIGITRYGRRILQFDHDPTRKHSPIIQKIGKVVIIESKSISEYLRQLESMGEDILEYDNIFGYSIGETEPRMPIFEYPEYNYKVTGEYTNLEI